MARIAVILSIAQSSVLLVSAACLLVIRLKYGALQTSSAGPGYSLTQYGAVWPFIIAFGVGVLNLFPLVWETILRWENRRAYLSVYKVWVANLLIWLLWIALATTTPS